MGEAYRVGDKNNVLQRFYNKINLLTNIHDILFNFHLKTKVDVKLDMLLM